MMIAWAISSHLAYAQQPLSAPLPADARAPVITVPGMPRTPTVRLELGTEQPGITYHVRKPTIPSDTEVVTWTPLCAAPCSVRIPTGTYFFALSTDKDSTPVEVATGRVVGPAVLGATYESRKGTRTAGWIVLGAGITIGTIIAIEYPLKSCDDSYEGCYNQVPNPFGIALIGISTIVGLVLVLHNDIAQIRVVPWSTGLSSTQVRPSNAGHAADMQSSHACMNSNGGLGVVGAF